MEQRDMSHMHYFRGRFGSENKTIRGIVEFDGKERVRSNPSSGSKFFKSKI